MNTENKKDKENTEQENTEQNTEQNTDTDTNNPAHNTHTICTHTTQRTETKDTRLCSTSTIQNITQRT